MQARPQRGYGKRSRPSSLGAHLGEEDYIANGGRVGQQHDQPVDADAADTIAELLALVAGTPMQADLQRIAHAIEEFDFEAAEQVLKTLLAQGRSL